MMENYQLKLKPEADIDAIWVLLESWGIKVLYSDEDSAGEKNLFIQWQVHEDFKKKVECLPGLISLQSLILPDFVFGLDIDPNALEHSRENIKLNQMDDLIHICTPEKLTLMINPVWVLINMISSEQEIAWKTLRKKLPNTKKVFSSGIRANDREEYLKLTQKWGWKEERYLEKEGWLGFEFSIF